MCNLMERYFVEERAEARAEERAKTRLEAIQNMLELGVPKDKIMGKYSIEEIEEAERQMLLTV